MRRTCYEVALGCQDCLAYNIGKVGFHPLTPATASLSFDQLAIDLAGPLPTSNAGYRYILVCVDIHTWFVLFRILKMKLTKEVTTELLKIFVDFSPPKILQSNNNPAFTRRVIDDLRGKFGFQHRSIIPYFPQQNGAVERHVGEAKKMVFKTIHGDTVEWEKAVLLV
jgi:hypothetical protein